MKGRIATHRTPTTVDPTQSSTAQLYGGDGSVPFNFSYGSGDVLGIYYTDNIVVGGASLTGAIIGVADEDIHEPRGILGVGLPADEVADIPEHDGVLELLVDQGYISSNSYSLYLDSYGKNVPFYRIWNQAEPLHQRAKPEKLSLAVLIRPNTRVIW